MDNLIQILAKEHFFLFAIFIGIIVSIDVFIVEFTRNYEVEGGKKLTSRMNTMACLHASFHALSFYIYIMIIYIFQFIVFFPIELFDLPKGIGTGLLTLINFLVICFIWWTYKSKIMENHAEKSDDSKAVDRRDMKLFVNVVRILFQKCNWGERIRGVAVVGAVAVDMLAISALLKSYLLPHGDKPAVSELIGNVFLDVLIFAVIIFVVVFALVIVAQSLRIHYLISASKQCFSFNFIVTLRVLEPFAVFFIVAGTVRSFMQWSDSSYVSEYGHLANILFSLLMVTSLFVSNCISWKDLVQIYKNESIDAQSSNPRITVQNLWADIKQLISKFWVVLGLFVCVFGSLWIAYSTNPGRDTHNHLIEATGYFACLVLMATIIFLYIPLKKCNKWERRLSMITKDEPKKYWRL